MSNQAASIPNFPTIQDMQRQAKWKKLTDIYNQLSGVDRFKFDTETAGRHIDSLDADELEARYLPSTTIGLKGLNSIVNNSVNNISWPVVQSPLSQLMEKAKLAQEMHDFMQRKSISIVPKCECGAKHTSSPNWHSGWCPMHEDVKVKQAK
jgi:hypothetical protein